MTYLANSMKCKLLTIYKKQNNVCRNFILSWKKKKTQCFAWHWYHSSFLHQYCINKLELFRHFVRWSSVCVLCFRISLSPRCFQQRSFVCHQFITAFWQWSFPLWKPIRQFYFHAGHLHGLRAAQLSGTSWVPVIAVQMNKQTTVTTCANGRRGERRHSNEPRKYWSWIEYYKTWEQSTNKLRNSAVYLVPAS